MRAIALRPQTAPSALLLLAKAAMPMTCPSFLHRGSASSSRCGKGMKNESNISVTPSMHQHGMLRQPRPALHTHAQVKGAMPSVLLLLGLRNKLGQELRRLFASLQDQYIEVNSLIPATATLFGAGEHISATGLPLRRDGVPLTLWTRDAPAADPDQNSYGSWPFLIDVRQGVLPIVYMMPSM